MKSSKPLNKKWTINLLSGWLFKQNEIDFHANLSFDFQTKVHELCQKKTYFQGFLTMLGAKWPMQLQNNLSFSLDRETIDQMHVKTRKRTIMVLVRLCTHRLILVYIVLIGCKTSGLAVLVQWLDVVKQRLYKISIIYLALYCDSK